MPPQIISIFLNFSQKVIFFHFFSFLRYIQSKKMQNHVKKCLSSTCNGESAHVIVQVVIVGELWAQWALSKAQRTNVTLHGRQCALVSKSRIWHAESTLACTTFKCQISSVRVQRFHDMSHLFCQVSLCHSNHCSIGHGEASSQAPEEGSGINVPHDDAISRDGDASA